MAHVDNYICHLCDDADGAALELPVQLGELLNRPATRVKGNHSNRIRPDGDGPVALRPCANQAARLPDH